LKKRRRVKSPKKKERKKERKNQADGRSRQVKVKVKLDRTKCEHLEPHLFTPSCPANYSSVSFPSSAASSPSAPPSISPAPRRVFAGFGGWQGG
jgi:hypothetical protein